MKPNKGDKMDTIFKTRSQKALDAEIERLINQLSDMSPVSKDYATISDNLRVLCEARDKKDPSVISTEMLIGIGANLIGLLVILNFEKTGIITSKAISFLWKK
jgi:hypothetical protein